MPEYPNLTPEENAALELAEAATPGPWRECRNRHPETSGNPWGWIERTGVNVSLAYWSANRNTQAEANARLMARARTTLPAALRQLAAARREVADLRAIYEPATCVFFHCGEKMRWRDYHSDFECVVCFHRMSPANTTAEGGTHAD